MYKDEAFRTFKGEMWTQSDLASRHCGINKIEGVNRPGLSRNPAVIHTGGNSGYQVIGLAYHLGAARIVLLGYDMQKVQGKSHWHGDHPKNLKQSSPYQAWVGRFEALALDLKAEGVEVINCTPGSALRFFPMAELKDVL